MLLGFWISVLFRHAEVYNVNNICCFRIWSANEKVVGFDVSIDQVLLVDRLDAGQLGMSARFAL